MPDVYDSRSQKLLILSANPRGTSRLRLDEEKREIEEGLKRSKYRDKCEIRIAEAVRTRDLHRAILDFEPNIIHFTGHGTGEAGLVFEDDAGQSKLVDAEGLAGVFELFADQVECVILNACYSSEQANAIAKHINHVIGMSQAIGDRAAIEFSVGFYDAIFADKPVEFSYQLGCKVIRMAGIPEDMIPQLLSKNSTRNPSLEELTDLVQVARDLCQDGYYDEAKNLIVERIYQHDRRLIVSQGAYQQSLGLLLEFFPDKDTSKEPGVSSPDDKGWILNEVGNCYTSVGWLEAARPLFERYRQLTLFREDWKNASSVYRNLSELFANCGNITKSAFAARVAVSFGRLCSDPKEESYSLVRQGWAAYLHGELEVANEIFQQAARIEQDLDQEMQNLLHSHRVIRHAECLKRLGDLESASESLQKSLDICRNLRLTNRLSMTHRFAGDLCALKGQHDEARQHYVQALDIARGLARPDVVIQALLSRGRWAVRLGEKELARRDIAEAMGYAVINGYRIYEVDLRICLARVHLIEGKREKAQVEIGQAQQISNEIEYYWGQLEASQVITV